MAYPDTKERTYLMKIKVIDIIIFFVFISLFKIYILPQYIQQGIKIFCILISLIYVLSHQKLKKFNNICSWMCISYIISSIANLVFGNLTIKNFLDGVLNSFCIFLLSGIIMVSTEKNYLDSFSKKCLYLTIIYCILSIISVSLIGTSSKGTEMTYIFGNKFSTCYFFVMALALFWFCYYQKITRYFRYKFFLILWGLFTLGFSLYVYCYTAAIGSCLLTLGLLLPQRLEKMIINRKLVIVSILIAGFFPFFVQIILNNSWVQYFVTNILGKTVGLTGRTYIYSLLPDIISAKPFWGYGYNSFIVTTVAGYGNAQNGLMENLINYGFIGTLLLIITVSNSFKLKDNSIKYYGFVLMIYMLILCSTVEITFNYYFYLSLFIMFYGNLIYCDRKQKRK